MKLKISKIKHVFLTNYILLAVIILILVFCMQILMLNIYYEKYKVNQLNELTQFIDDEEISISDLEKISFDYGICISIYKEGKSKTISNIYNKGCISGDKKNSKNYIQNFVNSDRKSETYYIDNFRFNNKNIVRAIKKEDMFVFLNSSIEPLDSSIVLLKKQFWQVAIIMLTFSCIIAIVVSKRLSEPIVEITDKAKQLENGNFDINFKTNSSIKEINGLSETLERAKNELSKTDELRRDLMANVGHDLKTPLTMIKAYSEMNRDLDNISDEKKKENLNVIIDETDRLNILVNDILDLSKLQSKTYKLNIEKFNLNDLIIEILKRYKYLIENEKYILEYNCKNKNILINADKKRIEQVIYNLINNAINYAGSDKKVIINLKNNQNSVLVEIKDHGKGIEKKEIDTIWDKYYHNEKKHQRNACGTGLGLSIVKSILEAHGYEYGVNSIKNKGTTFYFEISK